MRLAFAVDGGRGYAGVVLRQPSPDGAVSVELHTSGGAEPERVLRQTARIVSLDHDGVAFAELGSRDRVLGTLQQAHPGQRPVLFHSPYEGAAWSIISARRPAAQAAGVRAELSERFGATFELAGQTFHAFPQPERLIELAEDFTGLNPEKVTRLQGVARAALRRQARPRAPACARTRAGPRGDSAAQGLGAVLCRPGRAQSQWLCRRHLDGP